MSADAWKKLSECYEGKGKQSIAYFISELFWNTLLDDESMETQLNSMRQKANVLKTLGQPLEESLIAIAMVISLPPTYSTLRTILMAADDKLTTDAVISQVLIEEKSRRIASTYSALAVKTTGWSKQKGKGKVSKGDKGKKSCTTPCTYLGHLTRPPEGENRPNVTGQRMVAQEWFIIDWYGWATYLDIITVYYGWVCWR